MIVPPFPMIFLACISLEFENCKFWQITNAILRFSASPNRCGTSKINFLFDGRLNECDLPMFQTYTHEIWGYFEGIIDLSLFSELIEQCSRNKFTGT
jgi:hypothetical protein